MSGVNLFQKIAGTLFTTFRIGQNGPSIRQGVNNPGSDGISGSNGDLYIRVGSAPGLFQMVDGIWRETGSLSLERTAITDSTYTATNQNYYMGVSVNGTCNITLPAGTAGKSFVIKDEGGFASPTNVITLTPNGTDKFDGDSLYTITSARGSVTLVFGTEWHVI